MQAEFIKMHWENQKRSIATFYFRPSVNFRFVAGQYASFTIPHDSPDRRGITRTMTIASHPGDALVSFVTKFLPRPSSYKQALMNLEPGDKVIISEAMGDLILPMDKHSPLVFVAGGVAIASYTSIFEELHKRNSSRRTTVLYAARTADDVVLPEPFRTYGASAPLDARLYCPTKPAEGWWSQQYASSRLQVSDIASAHSVEGQIYVSGSERFVESIRQELEQSFRIPQYQIAFDFFEGYEVL